MNSSDTQKPQLLHIWGDYMPNLFDETHPYCLKQENLNSALIGSLLVENGAPVHPHSYFMSRQSTTVTASPSFKDRVIKKLGEPLFWRRYNRFCKKMSSQVHPNLLHVHFGTTGARILPFLKKLKLPFIVSFYGIDASESLKVPQFKNKYGELFKRATKVVVLCKEAKDRLIAAGCPPHKLTVWNMPAGIEKYPYTPTAPGKTTRFIICARFVEKKGYPYLLKAFQQIIKSGHSATLKIVGYGPRKEELLNTIESLKLQGSVTLIDTELSPHFDSVYRTQLLDSDVFVLPSTTASNGDDEAGPALTLVCAQSHGLPVICTPFPGSELSVIDHDNGLYCKQDNVDSLASCMEWMIANPTRWTAMGKAGSQLVQNHFSLESQMQAQVKMYLELLPEGQK